MLALQTTSSAEVPTATSTSTSTTIATRKRNIANDKDNDVDSDGVASNKSPKRSNIPASSHHAPAQLREPPINLAQAYSPLMPAQSAAQFNYPQHYHQLQQQAAFLTATFPGQQQQLPSYLYEPYARLH